MVFKCSAHISRRGSGSGARRTGFPITTPVFHCNSTCGNRVVRSAQWSALGRRLLDPVSTSNQQLPHASKEAVPQGDCRICDKKRPFLLARARTVFFSARRKENGGRISRGSLPQTSPTMPMAQKKPALDGPAFSFNISCACRGRLPSRARPPAAPRRCRTW